jgi:hypothetical protein
VNVIQEKVPAVEAATVVRMHRVVEVFDQILVVHAQLGRSA